MRFLACLAVVALLALTLAHQVRADDDSSDVVATGEFVATHEWQPVAPGQSVPAGLWVRMDIATGVKMARLLPEDEVNDAGKRLKQSRQERADQMAVVLQENAVEATEAAADAGSDGLLPQPGDDSEISVNAVSPAHESALLKARQERLRLLKANFYLKEDVEQMKQLLGVCIDPTSTVEEVVHALGVLEEFLHQIDNANDWSKIGGLDVSLAFLAQRSDAEPDVIAPAAPLTMTETDAENNATEAAAPPAPLDLQAQRLYTLQAHAAWVLGTAAQNNPQVQETCRAEGAVQVLTALYCRALDEERQAALDPLSDPAFGLDSEISPVVSLFQLRSARLKLLAKLLYALSALMRNNARTQQVFHALGGAELLATPHAHQNFTRCHSDLAEQQTSMRCVTDKEHAQLLKLVDTLQLKRVGLLHDLVVDHTVNAREFISPSSGIKAPPREGVSHQALFDDLTRDTFCGTFLDLVHSPSAAPLAYKQQYTHTQLQTRELALDIILALVSHRDVPAAPTTTDAAGAPVPPSASSFDSAASLGVCTGYYRATMEHPVTALLSGVAHAHAQWAAEAALEEASAEDASEGLAKYHFELQEAAQKVLQEIQP